MRIETVIEGDQIVMKVIDNGIGIAADKLAGLFEEFVQADTGVSRRFGGTGLGLTISRSLARLMHGDVRLESREGEGTTAIFTLPYLPAPLEETAPDTESAEAPARPLDVLVVDDVQANLDLIEVMLGQDGHRVTTADCAEDAFEILEVAGPFDVILMDIQMPGIDGLTATRAIRARGDELATVPIVALTADILPEHVALCLAAGMDDHVAKPLRLARLREVLARVAGQAPPATADAVIQEICDRYIEHMATFAGHLEAVGALPLDERAKAVAAFAHSVAGTAGSLGFDAVSQAAFRLQEVARAHGHDAERMDEAISVLLETVPLTRQAS